MYHEDVKVKNGETVSGIGADFGYRITEWHKIWDDPKNAPLVKKRGKPEHLQIDDVVWVKIPWHTVTRRLTTDANGASFLVQRNGQPGKRINWVQTVYRGNQPIGPNSSPFCVDACTPDDDLPFYWTDAELASPPQWVKDFSGDPADLQPALRNTEVSVTRRHRARKRPGDPLAVVQHMLPLRRE